MSDRVFMEEVVRHFPSVLWVSVNKVCKFERVYLFSPILLCDGVTVDPGGELLGGLLLTLHLREVSLDTSVSALTWPPTCNNMELFLTGTIALGPFLRSRLKLILSVQSVKLAPTYPSI